MASSSAKDSPSAPETGKHSQFKIRLANDPDKIYEVMRFNPSLNVDLVKWENSNITMEREPKEECTQEQEPEIGAGSEYNRKLYKNFMQPEEPERKQPWILEVDGKKFRGKCEGRISNTADYYAFIKGPNSEVKAHLLSDWHNFTPIERYKTLSAEEAEKAYKHRKKLMYYSNMIIRNHLKGVAEEEERREMLDDDDDEEDNVKKRKMDSDEIISSEVDSDVDEDFQKKEMKEPIVPVFETGKKKYKSRKKPRQTAKAAKAARAAKAAKLAKLAKAAKAARAAKAAKLAKAAKADERKKAADFKGTKKMPIIGIDSDNVIEKDVEKFLNKCGIGKNNAKGAEKISLDIEEAICRYLLRKPIEYTRLLEKLRGKFSEVDYEKLTQISGSILQTLNPEHNMVRGKMLIHLKEKKE